MNIQVYEVNGESPADIFEPGGKLYGFGRTKLPAALVTSERANALRSALGEDTEPVIGILPGGRLADLDLASLRRFALEEVC